MKFGLPPILLVLLSLISNIDPMRIGRFEKPMEKLSVQLVSVQLGHVLVHLVVEIVEVVVILTVLIEVVVVVIVVVDQGVDQIPVIDDVDQDQDQTHEIVIIAEVNHQEIGNDHVTQVIDNDQNQRRDHDHDHHLLIQMDEIDLVVQVLAME